MYFLHLGYDWSLCLAQLTPAIRCDFDVVSSGLPPPFSSLRTCLRSLLLLSWVSLLFCFGFYFSCFCHPRPSCFSISSLQPSSLFDPSPCIYTAGAYCFLVGGRGIEPHVSFPCAYIVFCHSCFCPQRYAVVFITPFKPSSLFPSRRSAGQHAQQNQHQRYHDAIHHILPAGEFLAQKVFDNVVHNCIFL